MKSILTCSLLFICLFLGSCSQVKFAYRFFDTLIENRVGQFIDFNDQQKDLFSKKVDSFVRDFRFKQLPLLSQYFKEFADDIESNKVSVNSIDKFFKNSATEIKKAIIPYKGYLIQVLDQLNQRQVDYFITAIDKKIKELEKQYKTDLAEPELHRGEWRSRHFRKNFRRWIGKLKKHQKIIVLEYYQKNSFPTQLRIENLRIQAKTFISVKKKGGNALKSYVDFIVEENFAPSTPSYMKAKESYYTRWRDFMVTLFSTLTKRQRKSFVKDLRGWAKDFNELAEILL